MPEKKCISPEHKKKLKSFHKDTIELYNFYKNTEGFDLLRKVKYDFLETEITLMDMFSICNQANVLRAKAFEELGIDREKLIFQGIKECLEKNLNIKSDSIKRKPDNYYN